MILQIFSIYDDKGTIYCQPFFLAHQGIAIRSFGDLVQDKQSTVGHHPTDYHLYKLGEYDDNSGLITPLKNPQFIAHAMEFTTSVNNSNQNNQIQTENKNLNKNTDQLKTLQTGDITVNQSPPKIIQKPEEKK